MSNYQLGKLAVSLAIVATFAAATHFRSETTTPTLPRITLPTPGTANLPRTTITPPDNVKVIRFRGTPQSPATAALEIVDGDTVVRSDGNTYRLVGFNTPETGKNAKCERERALGEKAARRLDQLLSQGNAELRRLPCDCPPGTEGTRSCNYGRLCGTLSVNGRDVGATLMAEGLAQSRGREWCG